MDREGKKTPQPEEVITPDVCVAIAKPYPCIEREGLTYRYSSKCSHYLSSVFDGDGHRAYAQKCKEIIGIISDCIVRRNECIGKYNECRDQAKQITAPDLKQIEEAHRDFHLREAVKWSNTIMLYIDKKERYEDQREAIVNRKLQFSLKLFIVLLNIVFVTSWGDFLTFVMKSIPEIAG